MTVITAALLAALTACGGTEPREETAATGGESTAPAAIAEDTETDAADEGPDVFPEGENIEIGIFWEPPAKYTNAEQYDRIRDANVTFIEITNREGAVSKEVSDEQIRLAGERGIKITYSVGVDGKKLLNMTEEQITGYAAQLAENPTITGIHVVDEPAQPWTYAKACAAIRKGGLMPRLNFLPYFATWVFDDYQGFVEDTIVAAGKENYGYLSYDQYPFPYDGGDPDMFYNLDLFRQIGLKYGVPTAFYIQSIGEGGNFRRTNGGEIRYHTSAGLAYGIKSMTYFTWWTTGFCDPKDYAIISPYGEKTDIYDDVAQINGDILRVGPLLRRLDALEVFHTKGSEQAIKKCKEGDVPIYGSTTGRYGLIISLMQDRQTGRDYVMLVNKNYKKEIDCELTVSDKITELFDCTDGSYEPVDISSGAFTAHFKAGGFLIFAAGKHDGIVDRVYDTDADLAKDKAVAAGSVEPGGGFYTYYVTDGIRDGARIGYKCKKDSGYLEVDLGRVTEINRVDLYPAGTDFTRGQTFPRDFVIEISSDGKSYTQVADEKDYTGALTRIPTFRFDVSEARYVRLTVSKGCPAGGFEIGEIEIYLDDGSVPQPDNDEYYADATDVKPGDNIALGKAVKVLSELGGDWRKENLTDGDRGSSYSSALNRHPTEDGEEWILIDLAAELEFNEVTVYPRGDGQHFPFRFRVEISDDAKTFTSIYDCDIPEIPSKGEPSVCTLDQTYKARYVRIFAYKLRDQKGFNDGHLLQAAEVEIYKKQP